MWACVLRDLHFLQSKVFVVDPTLFQWVLMLHKRMSLETGKHST